MPYPDLISVNLPISPARPSASFGCIGVAAKVGIPQIALAMSGSYGWDFNKAVPLIGPGSTRRITVARAGGRPAGKSWITGR